MRRIWDDIQLAFLTLCVVAPVFITAATLYQTVQHRREAARYHEENTAALQELLEVARKF